MSNEPSMTAALAHLEEHQGEIEQIIEALVLSIIFNGRELEKVGFDQVCAGFIVDVASVALGEIALDHYSEKAQPVVIALAKKVKADLEARAERQKTSPAEKEARSALLRPTQKPGKA